MTREDVLLFVDSVWDALHDAVGICGHCGKKKCAGRKENSRIVRPITPDQLTAAFEAASEVERLQHISAATKGTRTP